MPVDTVEIVADGKWNDINFTHQIKESSWIVLRIYASSHSNPVFAELNNKPIRIRKSAEWCRNAVDQCWKMKQPNIRPEEQAAAKAAYNKARKVYETIIKNSSVK